MLSKGFNKEFFESVYKLNECGGPVRCGPSYSDTSYSYSGSHYRSPAEKKKILNTLLNNQKLKDAGVTEKYIKNWWSRQSFYYNDIDEIIDNCLEYWNANEARKAKSIARKAETDRIKNEFGVSDEQIEYAKAAFSEYGWAKVAFKKAEEDLKQAKDKYQNALAELKSYEEAAGGNELWNKILTNGFSFED